jgi:hypothetical protein
LFLSKQAGIVNQKKSGKKWKKKGTKKRIQLNQKLGGRKYLGRSLI